MKLLSKLTIKNKYKLSSQQKSLWIAQISLKHLQRRKFTSKESKLSSCHRFRGESFTCKNCAAVASSTTRRSAESCAVMVVATLGGWPEPALFGGTTLRMPAPTARMQAYTPEESITAGKISSLPSPHNHLRRIDHGGEC